MANDKIHAGFLAALDKDSPALSLVLLPSQALPSICPPALNVVARCQEAFQTAVCGSIRLRCGWGGWVVGGRKDAFQIHPWNKIQERERERERYMSLSSVTDRL